MAHIEAKKMELAGGMLTREEKSCDMECDIKDKIEKKEKKVKKLKEELELLEASKCEMDSDEDDSEYEGKKKKLKKAEKKLKKLKEELSLMESGGDDIDETGEWSEEPNDEDSEDPEEE